MNPHLHKPLADLLRPTHWDDIVGQAHLTDSKSPFRQQIERGKFSSTILHGSAGIGKTTIIRLIEQHSKIPFFHLNAIDTKVDDIRKHIQKTDSLFEPTICLFIDEIHYFNTKQQDSLLSAIEDGKVILFGCTTHNPNYRLNKALLSRCQLYALTSLNENSMTLLIDKIIQKIQNQFNLKITIEESLMTTLALQSSGDARTLINTLEILVNQHLFSQNDTINQPIGSITYPEIININLKSEDMKLVSLKNKGYDSTGSDHFDAISCFIKSMRGTDPDAALFWAFWMIAKGEDVQYILRRMLIFASEDVGNADPRALEMVTSAYQAIEKVGLPEAEIILSQAICYLASTAKSNACYIALHEVKKTIEQHHVFTVPSHLLNVAKHVSGYQYPHDFPNHWVNQSYLPPEIQSSQFYNPSDQGLEKPIRDKLAKIRLQKGSSKS